MPPTNQAPRPSCNQPRTPGSLPHRTPCPAANGTPTPGHPCFPALRRTPQPPHAPPHRASRHPSGLPNVPATPTCRHQPAANIDMNHPRNHHHPDSHLPLPGLPGTASNTAPPAGPPCQTLRRFLPQPPPGSCPNMNPPLDARTDLLLPCSDTTRRRFQRSPFIRQRLADAKRGRTCRNLPTCATPTSSTSRHT